MLKQLLKLPWNNTHDLTYYHGRRLEHLHLCEIVFAAILNLSLAFFLTSFGHFLKLDKKRSLISTPRSSFRVMGLGVAVRYVDISSFSCVRFDKKFLTSLSILIDDSGSLFGKKRIHEHWTRIGMAKRNRREGDDGHDWMNTWVNKCEHILIWDFAIGLWWLEPRFSMKSNWDQNCEKVMCANYHQFQSR